MTSQPNLLVRLYRLTHQKYVTLTTRLERNVRSGRFQSFRKSRRNSILHKIEKLKRKLQQLSLQLKLGAAAGAVAFFLNTGEVKAQLGPFVQQDRAGNPVRPPLVDMFQLPTAADVDGDGDIDILVGIADGSFRYYENVGTPEIPAFNEAFGIDNPFDGLTVVGTDASPALGDMDGDGDIDLLAADGNGQLSYFRNDGGVFTQQTGTNNPFDAFNGSFDGARLTAVMDTNGDIDIVVGMTYDNTGNGDYLVMLENDGNGNFTRNDDFDGISDSSLKFPALADVDNDGDMDLFRGEDYYGSTYVQFYRQDPAGTFTEESGAWNGVSGNPFDGFGFDSYAAPLFVDLDNDSDLDAIVGRNYKYGPSDYENSLAYLENTGDFIFEQKSELENPFDGIVTKTPEINQGDAVPVFMDVDNDGDLDMLLGSKYNGKVLYYEFDETVNMFLQKTGTEDPFDGISMGQAVTIRTHDFNNDGFLDLFIWDSFSYLRYFENNQDGTFTHDPTNPITSTVSTTVVSVALLDVDGDGDEDLFTGIGYNPGFRFYRNNAGTYTQETTSAPFPFNDPTALGSVKAKISAEDFNNDGIKDLITGSQVTGEVRVFLNTNADLFGELTDVNYPFPDINTNIDTSPILVDYDGDGDEDLFVGDEVGVTSYLENQNPPPVVDVQAVAEPMPDQAIEIFPNLNLTDVDNDVIVRAVISINAFSPGDEEIAIPVLVDGIQVVYNPATGVLTISGPANTATYQALLRDITYENQPNAFPEGRSISKTISIQVFDEDGTTPLVATANLSHANDLPVVTTTVTSVTFTGSPVLLDNALTVEDDDDATISSATIRIVNYITGEDNLTVPSGPLPGGITALFNTGSGTLMLSGVASKANYQAALRLVSYDNMAGAPTTTPRDIQIRVNDGESNSAIETIVVNIGNDPVLAPPVTSADYTGGSVVVNGNITISDPDDTNMESATVTISAGFVSTEDVLTYNGPSNIAGTFDPATGTMILTGSASLAEYEAALESITYENTNGLAGDRSPRTITFVVNDGSADSNTISVTITYVNQAPVLASSVTSINYTGGQLIINPAITVTDADNADIASASISITGNFQSGEDVLAFTDANGIAGSYNATTGVLMLTGTSTVANYQAALRSITYENTAGASGDASPRTIEFVVSDGIDNSTALTTTINYSLNAPILASTVTGVNYHLAQQPVNDAITVDDADSPELVSASVTITDNWQPTEDLLAFNAGNGITGTFASGTLSLTGTASLADYQAALRSVTYENILEVNGTRLTRTVEIVVNDGTSNSNVISTTITYTNDAPVATNTTNPAPYVSGAVIIAGQITLADSDDGQLQGATVAITQGFQSGEDQLVFDNQGNITGTFNAPGGVLTLSGSASVAEYQGALRSVQYRNDNNGDRSKADRVFTFTVTDGVDTSAPVDVTLTLPNQIPNISITGNPPLYGSGAVLLAPSLTLADADNVSIQSATVAISAGLVPSEDRLLFTSQNGIIGNYITATGTLELTGSASLASYQTALLSVQYSNLSNAPTATPRMISFSVNDGLNDSSPVLLTLSINQAPTVADESGGPLVNNEVSIGLASLMSDPDNNLDLSTAEIVVPPASGAEAEIVDGELHLDYSDVSNYPGTERLTIRVCDALARCTEQEISIEIQVQVMVFNALSPNGDDKNDYFKIKFIRPNSRVSIYNRWGDRVYEQFDYDNDDSAKRFEGFNNNGTSLPSGTYFYKIELPENSEGPLVLTGYLTLKH